VSTSPTDASHAESPDQGADGGSAKPPGAGGGRGGFDARLLLPLLAIVVILGGAALLIAGGKSSPSVTGAGTVKGKRFEGLEATPAKPAFPLALRNYMGQRVNIDQYRGKAVLVTFLYTNCPDICPIITANLRVAQNLMGPKESKRVQIIAVSVDPRGDTPKAVAAFLRRHEMTGRMQYLIGDAHELGEVWSRWGVGSERDAEQPQFINHSGEVFGITASGKIQTLYAASFRPSEIAHDVPLLASE
jgi:protein SCO1